MSLTDALEAFGPEIIFFSDEIDFFSALKIRNRDKMTTLIMNVANRPDAIIKNHERKGKKYYHLKIPTGSILEKLEKKKPSERMLFEIFSSIGTHLFWTEENGYLIFASVPQALFDRADAKNKVFIQSWINEHQNAKHSLFNLSTRLSDTPAQIYYAYLKGLTLLSDVADHQIDIFSLPSARQAKLPIKGVYGIQLDWSDPIVSLSFTFENNPFEFLLSQESMATTATVGVLAAIAIPNFLDYRARSYDSAAVMCLKSAHTAAQVYFADHPDGAITTELLQQLGYKHIKGVVLTIEDANQSTLKIITYHKKGKRVYSIDWQGDIKNGLKKHRKRRAMP